MTCADYILQRLVDAGITHAFGIYGAGIAHLFDSFHRVKGITMIPTAHEQGAGFMAEGYAKAKGPFGVAVATSGPGALNLATPVANCYYDSVPVLFLCGQVSTKVMRTPYSGLRQRGFQECPIADVFKPITKYCAEVHHVHDVHDYLEAAIETMTMGRPGPAVLSLPLDILVAKVPKKWPVRLGSVADNARRTPNVTECLTAMMQAKRPVIIAGGGTLKCAQAMRVFAERFRVPVFPTWNAIEAAPDDWRMFGGRIGTYGGAGRNFAVQQADFALVIGCRISGRITGGDTKSFLRGARAAHGIWHVDVDNSMLAAMEPDVPDRREIHAYAESFLREATKFEMRASIKHAERKAWLADVRRWCDTYDPVKLHEASSNHIGVNPYTFVRELSRIAPWNAIVVSDCGGNAVIFHQAWKAQLGQRIISNHGHSPMGGALAYAIGAAIACPDRQVIAFIGDGGFTLGANELNTVRIQAERLKNLRVFVLNNESLGITAAWQVANLQGRRFACGPEPGSGYEAPDIQAVCRGYGVESTQISNPDMRNEQHCIHRALAGNTPLVVDVRCPGWEKYEPRITGWRRPIEEMLPSLPAEEFLAQMKYVEPMPGWKDRRE